MEERVTKRLLKCEVDERKLENDTSNMHIHISSYTLKLYCESYGENKYITEQENDKCSDRSVTYIPFRKL